MLLDEATSALDEATEARLLDNIKGMADKTCILSLPNMRLMADIDVLFKTEQTE